MKALFALPDYAACRTFMINGKFHSSLKNFCFFIVTVKSTRLQISDNSEDKESFLFICGFILGFITQFYKIFSPFSFMILCVNLPRNNDQNNSWVWVKWSLLYLWKCELKQENSCCRKASNLCQSPRNLSVKNMVKTSCFSVCVNQREKQVFLNPHPFT